MRKERRENKDGVYYSFVTADRKRLSRKEIQNRFGKDITTEKEADECLKLLEAEFEMKKLKIQQRLDWEKKYYNFTSLLEEYIKQQKKSAPNSWQNNEFYCKYYVLPYFLMDQKLNNIELWSSKYDDFKEWLEKDAKTIKSNRKLAYSSKNHAIRALNTFMTHLYDKKIISTLHKCSKFGEHLLNERTIDDIIEPEEMERICKRLKSNGHHTEALYYRYLYFTGMRFNEGLAISLGDLYQGELEADLMRTKMDAYKMKYFGYIVSDGQFGGMDGSGNVTRLPFKGKKAISEKHNRIIPIVDKVLWNELVDVAEKIHESKPKSKKTRNCLIFEGIDDATATRRLQEAFQQEKLKWRPWHCLRHSRATLLIGQTGDVMLARLWLGHSSPRVIEKYNHIYQAIVRQAKAVSQTGKTFGLKRA